jgi:PAS domain S-box-containing protein
VNILLVDDQPANLLALEATLQDLGHNLVKARSGEEAVRRLNDAEFALVLLDVQMPGLDGFETAGLIRGREESRHTPIIFLTAFESDRFPVEQAYSLGAVDYLVKPLVPVIVRAKVAGLVDLFEKTRQVKRQGERIRQIERREFEERLAEENAALRERVRLAAFGRDVAQALVQAHTLPDMLRHCAEAMVHHLHGAFARIWALDATETVLELLASAGLYTHLDGPHSRVKVGQYKIGLIAQERRPHLTNAVTSDPRVSDKAWAGREGMVAFAGYPLLVEGRLVGVMAMFSRQPLSDATLEAMASVADGIALGVERKRAEGRLREQREWLRVTLASIGDAVIATDTEGRVTFLNPAAQGLTGWPEDEAQGRPLEAVFIILHEQTRQPVENPVAKVIREGVVVGLGNHTVLVARDGTERPIDDSAAPIKDATGSMAGVVLTFRDVTEQRRAEKEVRQSEARKAAVLQTALDCIITIDHQGRVIDFNPAAERLFGYAGADVLGRDIAELIVPPRLREAHHRGMAHYRATGEGPVLGRRIEMPALRADGTEFPAELAITRIPTDGPPHFTAYLRDISERVRGERHRNARLVVTQVLSQAATVREAAEGVLRAVCEGLGWDVGFVWTLDGEAEGLCCLESWHRPEVSVSEFEATSRQRTFRPGEGLPGQIWSAGKPAWIHDVVHAPNFPRAAAAAKEGLHGAFGCPIVLGTQTLGVIEFFSQEIREPDADLLEMMATVAGQIGQFMERKQAEEQLRFQAHLLDSVGQAAIVTDPVGRIIYWNRYAETLYGWSRAEALGRNILEVTVAPAAVEQAAEIMELLRNGQSWSGEFLVRRRDRTTFPAFVTDTPIFDGQGQLQAIIGISADVTERKRVEQALRYLADASATLAAVVDYDSTLQKVAGLAVPHFADWCAVDMVEADGSLRRLAVVHADPAKVKLAHEFHRRYPPDPGSPHGLPRVLRTGESDMMADIPDALLIQGARDEEHLRLLRELGLRSYMCVPLKGRGKVLGAVTFVAAESGRRYTPADLAFAEELARRAAIAIENSQLYAELRQADRLKDEFLAMLAHELRNPLAPVRNALHILKQPEANAAQLQQVRDMAERQVQHMARLLDDLLDVSRISRGRIELRREAVDVAAVIGRTAEAARPVIEERRHEVTVSLPAGPLRVEADPTRLEQVLTNLLNNAAKYTDPGGRIWLSAVRDGNAVVVRVRDTGIGIAPEMLPRIFDLFVQAERRLDRAQGGVGIGLTLVKKLVELHGGRIEAASAGPGRGSEFAVRLPALVDDREGGRALAPAPGAASPLPRRSVLVVDDNQDAADSLAILLRLAGQDVRSAYDGPAALAQARDFQPAVVFLDIGMPGMDGYEVARRLRQLPGLGGVLLVALTGWAQEEDRRRSTEAGFDHHLVKPVEPDALQTLLADLPRTKE